MVYINSISDWNIILIVSENFSDSFLPRIENISNIASVYILSSSPNEYVNNSSIYIRGVHQSIDDLYDMVSEDMNPMKLDIIIFKSVYENRTTLSASFVYFQFLSHFLQDRNEMSHAFEELVQFARQEYEGNEYELAQIEEFEKTYKSSLLVSWLSRPCFILKVKKFVLFNYNNHRLFRCCNELLFGRRLIYYSNFV